jgi:HK97 family phage major capsid protein
VSIERMPGIVQEARRRLTIRNLLTSRPTTAGLIYYVKVNSPLTVASPQVESYAKTENAVTFTVASAAVKTIATWIPASRQVLDDMAELEGFLRASLPYYVNRQEETQILSGDNTGENLNGLITQSTAFNTALLSASAGWTRIDQIGAAIQQIAMIDEVPPSFVAMNPLDWWAMRRTKDSFGRYILGDPQSVGNPTIWDLTPVSTNSVVAGTFLVGGGDPAQCEIRDRMEMQVEISTEHADYFTRNLVAIRAEKRLALIVQRPQSYVHGTFTTSPA